MRERILVTGADGFIGSHLVEALVRQGRQVRALVAYNSFSSWGWLDRSPEDIRSHVDVIAGDVRDPHAMTTTVAGCDAVLHLAALIAIPHSYTAPASYVDTNVMGTVNLLQASRAAGVARFVHTSTSEVYGSAQYVPIDERHPLVGQSPYAASKIAADQFALSFHASFGLPVVVVRPFNTYGPRQSARAVIPTIISQAAAGIRTMALGATAPTRDFTYVDDTVSGFIAALDADGCEGLAINLGTGDEVSVASLVQVIGDVMGVELDVLHDPQRLRPAPSEVERLCSDNSRAAAVLGWRPSLVGSQGLSEGLRRTAAWFTDPDNLAGYAPDRYAT